MAYNFVACDRDQHYLMPPSINEWLPQDHLARFVLGVVDQMNLSAFYARHPRRRLGPRNIVTVPRRPRVRGGVSLRFS